MARICVCEYCRKNIKTTGKRDFRCCGVEQLIETHLKRPNNQNKATIKKRVVHKQLEKQDLKKLEPLIPTAFNTMEETKKEVTQEDVLPTEPEPQEVGGETRQETEDKALEENECSECGETGFPDDAESCPKCGSEFE